MRWLAVLVALACIAQATALDAEALLAHLRASGPVAHADRVKIAGLEFEDVSGVPRIADGKLYLEQLSGDLYGGTATGSVIIHLVDGSIGFQIDFSDVDLRQFLRRYAAADPGLTGRIDGSVDLDMPQGVGNLLAGTVTMTVRDGTLVDIGPLTDLLLGDPGGDGGEDTATGTIRVADRHAWIETMTVTSPSVVLQGRGSLAFDGATDILFSPYSTPGYLKVLPFMGDAMTWGLGKVTGAFGRFRIVGHIGSPRFVADPF